MGKGGEARREEGREGEERAGKGGGKGCRRVTSAVLGERKAPCC